MVRVNAGVIVFLLGCIVLLGAAVVAQRSQVNRMLLAGYERIRAESESQQGRIFIDSMHPWITSDKPGTCPICGMELIEVSLEEAKAMQAAVDADVVTVSLPPQQRVVANVALEEAKRIECAERITVVGEIVIPDNATHTETSWVAGRINRLRARTVGDHIAKGAPLLEVYSEDLVAAQEEYLVALKTVEKMEAAGYPELAESSRKLAASTARKMSLLGLTDAQIDEVAKTGKARDTVTVYAKYGGVILEVYADEGMYVPAGGMILQAAQLNPVWTELHIYEADQERVNIGDEVRITGAGLPADGISGRIFEFKPVLEESKRTLIALASIPNPGGKLKPGSFVDGEILKRERENPLVVPRDAVLVTGKGARVWVPSPDVENQYEPREVEIGRVLGEEREYYEVLSGLRENQLVVQGAVFLVDSEAEFLSVRSGRANGEEAGEQAEETAQRREQ
jgi:Cu(I)/Ag(I) efflux system membrane fusion protein